MPGMQVSADKRVTFYERLMFCQQREMFEIKKSKVLLSNFTANDRSLTVGVHYPLK